MDFTALQIILDLVQELDELFQELVHIYQEPIQDNTVPHSLIKAKLILLTLVRSRALIILANYLHDYISNTTNIIQTLLMLLYEIELCHEIYVTYNEPVLAPNNCISCIQYRIIYKVISSKRDCLV